MDFELTTLLDTLALLPDSIRSCLSRQKDSVSHKPQLSSTNPSPLTVNLDVSYAIPLLARLLSLFTSTPHTNIGGLYSLGKLSIPMNIIGLLYLLFTTITFNFPGLYPVISQNMNYTSAAIGVIMFIAVVTWITTGYKQFRGPESGGVVIEGGEVGVVADVEDEDEKKR